MSVSVQKLENAVEFYGAISNNKLHGLSIKVESNQTPLPPVVNGYASEGIIQFFFEDTSDDRGFNIYILMKATGLRCITIAKAAKRSWCVTSAASIRRRTIALPTARVLSISTCRSSIRLCTPAIASGDSVPQPDADAAVRHPAGQRQRRLPAALPDALKPLC